MYAVYQCQIAYKSPARYGDVIECDALLTKMSAVQMFFDQKVYLKDTQKVLVEASLILVSLNKDFKPTVIPERIREKLMGEPRVH